MAVYEGPPGGKNNNKIIINSIHVFIKASVIKYDKRYSRVVSTREQHIKERLLIAVHPPAENNQIKRQTETETEINMLV